MFLKAGALSLTLLLASRLLGLLRESAQAAALGTTGMADVAVLILTLPDWITGVLASGALSYVLLPHWAQQNPEQQAQTQRQVARWLLAAAVVMGVLLWLFQQPVIRLLASGLPPALFPPAGQGLVWCAVALPAALLAALWGTRLQHERDFIGLYGANLVVNTLLVAALFLIAVDALPISAVAQLGLGLVLAMGARLLWLRWRLTPFQPSPLPTRPVFPVARSPGPLPSMPVASLWLWAALSAGLPLTLPFAARAFVSGAGEGAMATFNYAWKLVELPLVLAIQLVATLAFPSITRAFADKHAQATPAASAVSAIRGAFALAWTLACAAAAALHVGAPAIATLLFGWGRMDAESVAKVAAWGALGAWGLLPQALIAVGLTVLAALGRMRAAVLAYAVALLVLLVLGYRFAGELGGAGWMLTLNAMFTGMALMVLWAVQANNKHVDKAASWLPWQAMLTPAAVLGMLTWMANGPWMSVLKPYSLFGIASAALAAIVVIAISLLASAELRAALKR